MLIPRIFHQIWVGPDPFPEEYAAYQQTWLQHHPGWELRFWTENNMPGELRRPEAAERLRTPAERANILRLELLWRHGGVYMDTDSECLRSIEPLIGDATFFITLAKPGHVNNALMGSVPEHPLVDEALETLQPVRTFGHDKNATGTRFLDTLLLDRPNVTLLDHELFYPQTPEAKDRAYAIHYKARSWKSPELLRIDLERAETRLEQILEKSQKRKLRLEQAEAELARLQATPVERGKRAVRRLLHRDFAGLQAFCLFAGYPRSGQSLLGSLLDAHPDMVIAHEVNVLKLVTDERASRRELFEALLENARAQAARPGGRRGSGSHGVPDLWQGRVRTLRVIGSKSGEKTSNRIRRDPSQLRSLARRVRVPLRILHVTRNPYDSIARMSLITRGGKQERTLAESTDLFGRLARENLDLIDSGKQSVLTVRHESLVSKPQAELRRVCEFLGVEPDDAYLEACASVVFESPKRTRELVEWTDEERAAVQAVIDGTPFLASYSWSSVH